MAKYDVHQYPGGAGYLLDVQADLLEHLNTRVVVPLLPSDQAPDPAAHLNPVFVIGDAAFTMLTQFLAAVPKSELGPVIASVEQDFEKVTRALDMVFHGF